ncbi:beta-lactamase [Cyclobacterium marinum DSM 745]|uniref:Beta-lactamase n=2 Tax=Cyclobacterium marinum TaxID=104 RepID=G0IV93_CYCMS|nr:beta-lactamase [Cyclobacterium marinum DSM 745]
MKIFSLITRKPCIIIKITFDNKPNRPTKITNLMKSIYQFVLLLFVSFQVFGQENATDFQYSSPTKEKVDAKGILSFLDKVEASEHELHSLMILRRGKVIAEGWWEPYGTKLKHTMYSVSKTYTATAIGLAVNEGLISVEDKVIKFFPHSLPEKISDNLKNLQIKHLLTMSVGHAKDYTFSIVKTEDWASSFFAVPIVNQPGEQFVYNTIATYMLSAIVQKVSGQTLLEYLQPRLFKPLGIEEVDWEMSPQGINTGGYGLRVKTEDMAKLGQLFLQNGNWNGQQILPESWIKEARSLKILQNPEASKEDKANSDWLQGYGYQMWRSRHESYRADGAFGQYILILPKQEAVIVITSETSNLQALLSEVWNHILPAFDSEGNISDDLALQNRLENLSHKPTIGVENRLMEGLLDEKSIAIENNGRRIEYYFDFQGNNLEINSIEDQKSQNISSGKEVWVAGMTERKQPYLVSQAKNALNGLAPYKVFSSYHWEDFQTLVIEIKYIESPHTETIKFYFDGKKVNIETSSLANRGKSKVFQGILIE